MRPKWNAEDVSVHYSLADRNIHADIETSRRMRSDDRNQNNMTME